MEYALESMKNDCKNCYKCIRKCPVKSISFSDDQASIIHEDCILCGTCFLACPQSAKVIRKDYEAVKRMIKEGDEVIVSLAPSYVVNYPGASFSSIKKALLKLGFKDVEETAIGATIVKKAYDEMVNKGEKDVIISSSCHSVNLMIEKYYPSLLPYLADCLSPMQAHGKDLKKRHPGAKVVFIGPCIAKKDESDSSLYVEKALTFLELDEWIKKENITIDQEEKEEKTDKSKARLFPISGGILRTMEKKNQDYEYLVVDGIERVKDALIDIEKGKVHHCFIEMSACEGSCINGPAIRSDARAIIKGYLDINKAAGKTDFDTSPLSYKDIKKTYVSANREKDIPTEEEITECLKQMGKTSKDQELNCGSCGYNSCREKAIAIINGKAVKEMCLPFLMEKSKSFSDKIITNTPNGIMVIDENYRIQLANQAMCSFFNLSSSDQIIGKMINSFLDPESFALAISGKNVKDKKMYLNRYDKYAELTAVYDPKFHIVVSIIRDITDEERSSIRKAETVKKSINVTNKVIEDNMRAVQEIASLLGESVAETKLALSTLQKELKDDK